MLDILAFLFVVFVIVAFFKVAGLIFKTGIFLLSLPLMILVGIILAVVFFAIFPVALIGGLLTVIFAPLVILTPLLPLVLIGFGILLLARNR
jgi:hypothetical protein